MYLFASVLTGVLVLLQLAALRSVELQSLHDPLSLHTHTTHRQVITCTTHNAHTPRRGFLLWPGPLAGANQPELFGCLNKPTHSFHRLHCLLGGRSHFPLRLPGNLRSNRAQPISDNYTQTNAISLSQYMCWDCIIKLVNNSVSIFSFLDLFIHVHSPQVLFLWQCSLQTLLRAPRKQRPGTKGIYYLHCLMLYRWNRSETKRSTHNWD